VSAEQPPSGDTVLRGTLFALLAQLTTALFTAVLVLYLARALGSSGYGVFSLAVSVLTIGMLLADAAISHSAGRFIADARHDLPRVRQVVAAALRMKLVAALVVAGVLALLADPIADAYGIPEVEWPLRGIALSLVFETTLLLWLAVFGSLRRQAVTAQVIFVESLVEVTASVGLVALGAGATGAAFGRAAGYAVGAILGAVLVRRLIGRFGLRGDDAAVRAQIRGYARPLFATNSAYTAYAALDIQLIAALLTATAVGLFSAPLRLVVFLGYVGQSVANAVAPRMSLEAPGGPDVRAFTAALRGLLILHVALAVGIAVWAEPITDLLLGEEFEASDEILRWFAPYLLLRGVSPLISTTVNYLGQAGRRLPIVLASLAVNAAIDVALLDSMGPAAAALGTSVAYCIYVPAHLRLCRQAFPIALRPLALSVGRSLLAGAALAGLLFLLGTDTLGAPEWAAGLVLGPLVFAGVLLATGELSRGELAALRSRLAARWR
jgi:O-antigen/teichoic acid export membrane protein